MEQSLDEPPSWLLLEVVAQPDFFYLAGFIIIILLLIFSALISASEVAFFSLKPEDIAASSQSKKKSDKAILDLLHNPKKLLATILILNNFGNVAIVTLSTFLMWQFAGTQQPEKVLVASVTFAITFAITFFGEIIPKVYATQNNVKLAHITAVPIVFSQKFLTPLTAILLSLGNLIEKKFKQKGFDVSMEELNQALEITTQHAQSTEEEKDLLKGIVNFGTLTVKQVMKSRLDITAVDAELNYHELLDKINKSGFSRIPVYKDTIDNIQGILYIKDLLPFIDADEHFKWQELLRPGMFIPETKKVDSLLKDFQEKRVHVALVVDEYGGVSGLITLEDVIEEIIGEINDEFDEEDVAYNKLDDRTYVFEGKTSLNDFCKILEIDNSIFDEVKGESESLGGLILELNSKLPQAGDKIKFRHFLFTIVAVDKRRIKRVRVYIGDEQ
ncbi:MAG TPA: gliding motility-associated protein GldE [Cyclobacteriaceae bacterium]|nr:gliding motility-associated protein GldE [Cyclobacteriaceae bacterium]